MALRQFFERLTLSDRLTLQNATEDPSANGEIRRNGNDVKVQSGGSTRNFSNIGAGDVVWQEDGASPINVSGVASASLTLSSTWDQIFVLVESVTGDASQNENLQLTLNGDGGSNYNTLDVGGTQANAAHITVAAITPNVGEISGDIRMAGRWDNRFTANFSNGVVGPEVAHAGDNTNITSPLDSMTFQWSNGNITMRAEVFGRNGP